MARTIHKLTDTIVRRLTEMLAIGWQPVASLNFKTEQPQHVFEYAPDDWDGRMGPFTGIKSRINSNDRTFWPTVSRMLYDRGLREDTHPKTRDEWWRRKLPAQFTPETYVDYRLARGWRFELCEYVDEEGEFIDTTFDEIAPHGYWDDVDAVWPHEHAIDVRCGVGLAWIRAMERELIKRGYNYVVRVAG